MHESGSRRRNTPEMRRRRKQLARFLREKREELQISIPQFAAMIGVSRWTYQRWEDGHPSIPVELVPAIARALAVDLAEVISFVAHDPRRAPPKPKVIFDDTDGEHGDDIPSSPSGGLGHAECAA